jgi:eukaryotic-like serine/threonine-protein kinase
MRLSGTFGVIGSTMLALALPAAAQQSSMFRADSVHSGRYDGPALPHALRIAWRFSTDGPLIASPAGAGGTVYVASTDGHLYAVDRATGRARWTFATEARIPSSPAVAGGIVYFLSSDGNFYAVDAAGGTLRWKFKTGDVVHASPALADGTVYIGSWDSWFYALDAATGALRWRFQTGEDPDIHNQVGISSSALVAGRTVYVGCRDGHLYALDARTGTARWSFDTHRAWVTSSPVVSGASVYFGAGSSYKFFGVDTATGRATLELQFRRGIFSSPIVSGGTLYTADIGGPLTAVDLATGKAVGRFRTDASRRAEVAYLAAAQRATADTGSADPAFYDHMVARFDQARRNAILASPVVVGGLLFLASADGNLYALH